AAPHRRGSARGHGRSVPRRPDDRRVAQAGTLARFRHELAARLSRHRRDLCLGRICARGRSWRGVAEGLGVQANVRSPHPRTPELQAYARSSSLPCRARAGVSARSSAMRMEWCEYDASNPKLLALYAKGKVLQWNADLGIDWSRPVDPGAPVHAAAFP